MIWDFDKPVRAELQKDADGFYPGERERGFPDFLRRTRKVETASETVLPWAVSKQ